MAVIHGKEIDFIKNDAQAAAVTLEKGRKSQRVNAGSGLHLRLRVSPSGTVGKSWEHQYRHKGKNAWLSLGTFNPKNKAKHVSCADAREKLRKAMSEVTIQHIS